MTTKAAEVITNQPLGKGIASNHTELDFTPPACRSGFEPFLGIEEIILKQKRTDYIINDANEYEILSKNGKELFSAYETTDAMGRLLRSNRQTNFTVKIGNILTIQGDVGTLCCGQSIARVSSRGLPVGSVVATGSTSPKFVLKDRGGSTGITIEGNSCSDCWCCRSCSCVSTDFIIYDINEGEGKVKVGEIDRQWAGTDVLTHSDKFCIKFPRNMDATHKALILCASILIDYQYFPRQASCVC